MPSAQGPAEGRPRRGRVDGLALAKGDRPAPSPCAAASIAQSGLAPFDPSLAPLPLSLSQQGNGRRTELADLDAEADDEPADDWA